MENLEEIKNILTQKGIQINDEELFDTSVTIEHLIELWLDSFEKGIFKGETLQELLETNII